MISIGAQLASFENNDTVNQTDESVASRFAQHLQCSIAFWVNGDSPDSTEEKIILMLLAT